MQLLRCAFDPADLANPGKVFPTPRLCGEVPGPAPGRAPAGRGRAGGGLLMAAAGAAARRAAAGDRRSRRGGRRRRRRRRAGPVGRRARLDRGGGRGAAGRRGRRTWRWWSAARGTKLALGHAARAGVDLVVDTHRLDRVVEHAAGDLVVVAEAGLPPGDAAGRRWPAPAAARARPAAARATTVGGMRRHRRQRAAAAAVRRGRATWCIGVTMVRADGVVAKAGGKVVKNVAGYDLGQAAHRLRTARSGWSPGGVPAAPAAAARPLATSSIRLPDAAERVPARAAGRCTRSSCRPRSRSTGRRRRPGRRWPCWSRAPRPASAGAGRPAARDARRRRGP